MSSVRIQCFHAFIGQTACKVKKEEWIATWALTTTTTTVLVCMLCNNSQWWWQHWQSIRHQRWSVNMQHERQDWRAREEQILTFKKKEWLFIKRFVKASESWCFASWQKISKSINQQQQQQRFLTTTSAQWQRINKKILHVKQKKATETETITKKWNRQTRKSTIAHDEICWFASQASTKPVGCWGTWKEEKPILSCKSH